LIKHETQNIGLIIIITYMQTYILLIINPQIDNYGLYKSILLSQAGGEVTPDSIRCSRYYVLIIYVTTHAPASHARYRATPTGTSL